MARAGFLRAAAPGRLDAVGQAGVSDCRQSEDWRAYTAPRALFEAWSPPADSPWSGFARPTLFAALDGVRAVRPGPVPGFGSPAPDLPRDRRGGTAIVLDLPARVSVAYAALLARETGHEPVVAFNNWPHRDGVVEMADALAALLHFVPWVVEARHLHAQQPRPVPPRPPVFVLDRARRGQRKPRAGEFDNRYYHVDADLPSAAQFRRQGITRVVYVHPGPGAADPALADPAVEPDDLNPLLVEWAKALDLEAAPASLAGWRVGVPVDHRPRPRKTVFTTVKDPAFRGYRRAAAGGFGRLVPERSSSG